LEKSHPFITIFAFDTSMLKSTSLQHKKKSEIIHLEYNQAVDFSSLLELLSSFFSETKFWQNPM